MASFHFGVLASPIFVIYCVISFFTRLGYPKIIFILFFLLKIDFIKENIYLIPNWFRSNPRVTPGWCEPLDGVHKWNRKTFSYLKILKSWKYAKISQLHFQKIPWKITDLKISFLILEIINSISSFKNDEICFVLLIKLWTLYAVSMKSIR